MSVLLAAWALLPEVMLEDDCDSGATDDVAQLASFTTESGPTDPFLTWQPGVPFRFDVSRAFDQSMYSMSPTEVPLK